MMFSLIWFFFFLRALRCYCCSRNAILCTLRRTSVCVSMVTAPAHSRLAAFRPRSRPDGPSECWAPSRAGFWAVSFSVAAQSWWGQRISALSCGPGQRREESTCLCWGRGLSSHLGPVLWSSTWQPCPDSVLLVLQVGGVPALVHWES